MGNLAFCSIKNSPDARLQFTGPLDASRKDEAYWEAVIYDSSVAAIQPQTAPLGGSLIVPVPEISRGSVTILSPAGIVTDLSP